MVFKFPIAHWMRARYPTTRVEKLLPRIRYPIPAEQITVRAGEEWRRQLFGKQMRLQAIAKFVTQLIRDERVELSYFKAYEIRNYTERLIMEAIRNGDLHRPTMETANFYLLEKNLIHKLFKVLVPRYMTYSSSFTSMYLLPLETKNTTNKKDTAKGIDTSVFQMAVLELKVNFDQDQVFRHLLQLYLDIMAPPVRNLGLIIVECNPLPNVRNESIDSKNFLTNVLLRAAKREYFNEKVDKNTKN